MPRRSNSKVARSNQVVAIGCLLTHEIRQQCPNLLPTLAGEAKPIGSDMKSIITYEESHVFDLKWNNRLDTLVVSRGTTSSNEAKCCQA